MAYQEQIKMDLPMENSADLRPRSIDDSSFELEKETIVKV